MTQQRYRPTWTSGRRFRRTGIRGSLTLAVLLLTSGFGHAVAQVAPQPESERLVALALETSPAIRAAAARVEAARAAINPAGSLPDPMLAIGISNFPVSDPGFADFMTMKMVGVGQLLPYPGKRGLRRAIAREAVTIAEANLETTRLAVMADVRTSYYELAFIDRALEIVRRNESLLGNLVGVTEARYGVGRGEQADVLTARVELARLAEEAVGLTERRRAVAARLNAALDRSTEEIVADPAIPEQVARAAVPDDARRIRFVSSALGSRAADSPLPPLAVLQEEAVTRNPEIRAHGAMIQEARLRLELARKEHLPDFDLSLQYGQRTGRSDMVSAMVSVALPVRKSQRQDAIAMSVEAEIAALEAEHQDRANELRAAVATRYADLERHRAQLALFVKSILPQGRAALESATAGLQVGRVDFLTLLENQATLYEYETQYHRSLADFAIELAALERTVGGEVLR